MSKLELSIDNLSDLLESGNIPISVNIFSKIIEDMWENELFSKGSFLYVFENILSGKGISEIDANIFLEIIDSKSFRKSYIEIIKGVEYKWSIKSNDIEKIERHNNPLYNIWKLKIKLNSLIIKSRLINALEQDIPKNYVHHEWKKYIDIWGEVFELLKKVWNIWYIKNRLDWTFSIYKEIDFKREIFLPWKFAIWEVESIGWKDFVTFDDSEWIWLYDISRREILISWKKSIWKTINIWWKLFVDFKNKDSFVGLYNISTKEVIIYEKKRISTIKKQWSCLFVDFEDNKWEWLYYINLSETLLSWHKWVWDIEKKWWKLFVDFKDEQWKWLYGITDKEVLLSWKELLWEIKHIWWKLFIYFEDNKWKWLYNISDKKILLSWKKVIIYDKDRFFYKDKWLISSKKELHI